MAASLQSPGMLSKEQWLYLFGRFSILTSQPDVKKRIRDAVKEGQEAVAVTTAIQEEIFSEIGVDPGFGITCLGKLSTAYENDRDLIIQYYKFLAREEVACYEAELGPEEFEWKMQSQRKLQEQQLEMLKCMRKFNLDDQSAILQHIRQRMEEAEFDDSASVLSEDQIRQIVTRRVSPLFKPG